MAIEPAAPIKRPRSLFGEILRRELEAQGVSNRELARRLTADQPERLENTRRALIRYIRGEVVPNDDARLAIAAALRIDPGQFAPEPSRDREREILHAAVDNLLDALMFAVDQRAEGAARK